MTFLHWLLIIGFLGGQLVSLAFDNGIRIALLDLAVFIFVAVNLFKNTGRSCFTFWLKTVGPFIVVAITSLLFAAVRFAPQEIAVSSLYLARFVMYSMLLVTAGEKAESTLKTLWICGIGLAMIGLTQYFIYPNLRNLSYLGWDPHQYRLFSTVLDPNFTGILFVLFLILNQHLRDKLPGLWSPVGFFSGTIALVLTYSRGAYLTFLSIIAVRSAIERRIRELLVLVVVIPILFVFLPKPGGEGVNLLRYMSIESRISDAQEAISIWQSSPIFGVGFNTLRYNKGETMYSPDTQSLPHAGAGFHNGWLFVLATTGIVGLAAYMWMWWGILGHLTRKNPVHLLLFLSLFAVHVHSLFDNSLFFPPVMFWTWCLIGSARSYVLK